MAVISMKQLLEAGVHFGHQTRRWNPKMKQFIFTERNGIYIIDLQKTVKLIDEAYDFVKDAASNDGVVLFVGTKKQAQDAVEEEAKRCGRILRKPSLVGRYFNKLEYDSNTYQAFEGNQGNGRRRHV